MSSAQILLMQVCLLQACTCNWKKVGLWRQMQCAFNCKMQLIRPSMLMPNGHQPETTMRTAIILVLQQSMLQKCATDLFSHGIWPRSC